MKFKFKEIVFLEEEFLELEQYIKTLEEKSSFDIGSKVNKEFMLFLVKKLAGKEDKFLRTFHLLAEEFNKEAEIGIMYDGVTFKYIENK
jgi:hypothetical protein